MGHVGFVGQLGPAWSEHSTVIIEAANMAAEDVLGEDRTSAARLSGFFFGLIRT